jgi:hypothetical protein
MATTTPKTSRVEATDTVIAEVRRVKADLMKRYDYDMAAMMRDARARQAQSGHKVITKVAGV